MGCGSMTIFYTLAEGLSTKRDKLSRDAQWVCRLSRVIPTTIDSCRQTRSGSYQSVFKRRQPGTGRAQNRWIHTQGGVDWMASAQRDLLPVEKSHDYTNFFV